MVANAHFNLGLLLSEMDDATRHSEAVRFLQAGSPSPRRRARWRRSSGVVGTGSAWPSCSWGASARRPRCCSTRTWTRRGSRAVAAATEEEDAASRPPTSRAQPLLYAERSAEAGSAANEFVHAHVLQAVLHAADCAALVAVAEAHAAANGGWTRGRHEAYPTTDLPLSALPRTSAAVTRAVSALRDSVLPAMVRAYPSLAGLPLFVDDAFVAKYAAGGAGEEGTQRMLAFHRDATPLSFICTLARPAAGGGTVFRSLLPPVAAAAVRSGDATAAVDYGPLGAGNASVLTTSVGECLVFAGGAALHGGAPVTAGVRHLRVGFVQVGRGGGAAAVQRGARSSARAHGVP